MSAKIVAVTGANTGVGLALCQRLLAANCSTHIFMLCRNLQKAEEAKFGLMVLFPESTIEIVQCDTSCPDSVQKAAKQLTARTDRLDVLYLNAGVMPSPKLNMKKFFRKLFSSEIGELFTTARGVLELQDTQTTYGLPVTFSTNVLGHFLLIKGLLSLLRSTSPSQIVWTGSSNADYRDFNIDDIQSVSGPMPYSSSKYLIELINYQLNQIYNSQGIYSHVICPGTVLTNMTFNIMPYWLWYMLTPIIYLIRIFIPSFTRTTHSGAYVLEWISKQEPASLDPMVRYRSQVSPFGRDYVKEVKLNLSPDLCEKAYDRLLEEVEDVRQMQRLRSGQTDSSNGSVLS